MGRSINANFAEINQLDIVVPIGKGGSGTNIPDQAIENLDGIPSTRLNTNFYPVVKDANDNIPSKYFSSKVAPFPALFGSINVKAGSINTYNVTNFNPDIYYDVTVSSGIVTMVYSQIVFTAPIVPGVVKLTVNCRECNINVLAQSPAAPVVTGTDLFYNGVVTVELNSSAFTMLAGAGTHHSTDWRVARDILFTDPVHSVDLDTVNKLGVTVNSLATGSFYYAKCRHRDSNMIVGPWSDTAVIRTDLTYVLKPEQAIITSTNSLANDRFGRSVSITEDGSRLIIGSFNRQYGFAGQGAFFIFKRTGTTWAQETVLTLSDPLAANEYFGTSVAIDGDGTRAVIGAPSKGGTAAGQGAIYVFKRTGTTWAQEAKLVASDPVASANLGTYVAISLDGLRVAGGAPLFTDTVTNRGAVYIYNRAETTWTQEQKLLVADTVNGAYLGTSLSFDRIADRLVVGARAKNVTLTGQGAAYVFKRSGTVWTEEQRIIPIAPMGAGNFGVSVDITKDGTRIAVGSDLWTEGGITNRGAVYVFLRTDTTWAEERKIIAADAVASDSFGYSVKITGDGGKLITGAYKRTTNTGRAYVWVRSGTTWTEESIITASNLATNNFFGYSVDISANGLYGVVGAYNSNTTKGSTYIYVT